jgi:hypothetical protein
MQPSLVPSISALVLSMSLASTTFAEEAAPAFSPQNTSTSAPSTAMPVAPSSGQSFPRVGGHLGFALPIVAISDQTTVIGSDFVAVGLTPGVTVKLDERWAVDFEFIAKNELKDTPAGVTWVVAPGVVYSAGAVSAGLRIATVVGALSNIGLVPIVVLPVAKISETIGYYIEGDVPVFLYDGGDKAKASVGLQFQSGFSF